MARSSPAANMVGKSIAKRFALISILSSLAFSVCSCNRETKVYYLDDTFDYLGGRLCLEDFELRDHAEEGTYLLVAEYRFVDFDQNSKFLEDEFNACGYHHYYTGENAEDADCYPSSEYNLKYNGFDIIAEDEDPIIKKGNEFVYDMCYCFNKNPGETDIFNQEYWITHAPYLMTVIRIEDIQNKYGSK